MSEKSKVNSVTLQVKLTQADNYGRCRKKTERGGGRSERGGGGAREKREEEKTG